MAKRRRRTSRSKLTSQQRKSDARKRLFKPGRPSDILKGYVQRFKVSEMVAYEELLWLGFEDELRIQQCDREGIAWEYKVDPLTDDMKVVPEGTPDWELHLH